MVEGTEAEVEAAGFTEKEVLELLVGSFWVLPAPCLDPMAGQMAISETPASQVLTSYTPSNELVKHSSMMHGAHRGLHSPSTAHAAGHFLA